MNINLFNFPKNLQESFLDHEKGGGLLYYNDKARVNKKHQKKKKKTNGHPYKLSLSRKSKFISKFPFSSLKCHFCPFLPQSCHLLPHLYWICPGSKRERE
jgi:hypothetical protein